MNILHLLGGNGTHRPRTQRFPDRQAPAADFRGDVTNDPALCVACGICAQVCPSAAIELTPSGDSCAWVYDSGRCTFCGICVQHCPVDALRQAADRGATSHRPGEREETEVIPYPPCPECGRPAMPISERLIDVAYGRRTDELDWRARLCEQCRRRATGQVMRRTFGAMGDDEGSGNGR